MVQLSRSIKKLDGPEHTKKGQMFVLEVPLVDLGKTDYVCMYLRSRAPPLITMGLKLDATASPPRINLGVLSDDLGATGVRDFISRNVLPPFREFLAVEGILTSSLVIEVAHLVRLVSSELGLPSRSWFVDPIVSESISRRHFSESHPSGGSFSRNSRSPYLLMEGDGTFKFGWINDDHIDKSAGHPDILDRHPTFQERGGGEILLSEGVLSLFSSSSNFGSPDLALLKDAAAAVVASLSGRLTVNSVVLEGLVEHEFLL